MDKQAANKLMVAVGSILAANGVLLAVTPRRFATLRKSSWTPKRFDTSLDQLASSGRASGLTGAGLTLIGLLLLIAGIMRTRPSR
jgi:hypothetical protein